MNEIGGRIMGYQETDKHNVWLNDQERIASFHHVDGYSIRSFSCHDFFMNFLHSLQERGYRFQ